MQVEQVGPVHANVLNVLNIKLPALFTPPAIVPMLVIEGPTYHLTYLPVAMLKRIIPPGNMAVLQTEVILSHRYTVVSSPLNIPVADIFTAI
jgi:hypothetical protein